MKLIELPNNEWIDPHLVFRVQTTGDTVIVFFGDARDHHRIQIKCDNPGAASDAAKKIAAGVNFDCVNFDCASASFGPPQMSENPTPDTKKLSGRCVEGQGARGDSDKVAPAPAKVKP